MADLRHGTGKVLAYDRALAHPKSGGLANGTDRPNGSTLHGRTFRGAGITDCGTSTASAAQQITGESTPSDKARTGTS